ncbi:hypothetical protein BUALT_Bualt02G0111700 [Buddleja alternifolia]|uniref:Uncharacterized protein n=1 Tax=Buddleja alternifolia TaxID=168488 RepID=A0AAV6YAE0_9LAMI|nr:hypothetical protein BUALT_Bualt02G0111700 [Buddleja alternifolia]
MSSFKATNNVLFAVVKIIVSGICASLTKALAVTSRDTIASVSKCGFEDSARALSASVRYLHGHCYTAAFQGADEDLDFSAKRRLVRYVKGYIISVLADSHVARVFFSSLKPKYCKVLPRLELCGVGFSEEEVFWEIVFDSMLVISVTGGLKLKPLGDGCL